KIRAKLLDLFSFERRELGQDAFSSEAISAMQSIAGVAWVDVDAFGSVAERTARRGGEGRRARQAEPAREGKSARNRRGPPGAAGLPLAGRTGHADSQSDLEWLGIRISTASGSERGLRQAASPRRHARYRSRY